MENQNKPIYPTLLRQIGKDEFRIASEKDSREGMFLSSELGITKREYFAGLAMQGLLSSGKYAEGIAFNPIISKLSIEIADELLNQLNP